MRLDIFYLFESSVNSEYSKTELNLTNEQAKFESSVNSEYSKTLLKRQAVAKEFESSVNSEYSKTLYLFFTLGTGLRVV